MEQTIGNILGEEGCFSLSHLFEADSDLDASIVLASNLYYKQSLQVLRSYIETMVLHLYFANNPYDFEKWKRA